jgi:hypothetical protein
VRVVLGSALVFYAAGALDMGQALTGLGDHAVIFMASLLVAGAGLDAAGVIAGAKQILVTGAGRSHARLVIQSLTKADTSKHVVVGLFALSSLFGDATPATAQLCSSANALLPDTDGDGIADVFELFGCADSTGSLDFPAWGVHPLKKDIFVHADIMVGVTVDPGALQDVINAFAAAPVLNPDGTTGITLHIDASGSVPFATQTLFADSLSINDRFVAPRISVSPGGLVAVSWQDDRDGNGHYDVYVRRFDAAGTPTTREILVNSNSRGQQRRPAVAINDSGDFVVVWEDDRDDNGYYQILGRTFDSFGNPLSGDVTVNPVSEGQQVRPTVGIDSAGNWVAAWEDDRDGNGYYDIFARRFDRTGVALGGEVRVNQISDGQQTRVEIAMAPDGRALVVWEDDQDGDGYYQIVARRLDAGGVAAGNQFTINEVSAGQHRKPVVATNASGTFVVVWEDDQDPKGHREILGRLVDARGAPSGNQFTVNEVSDGQRRRPSVGMNAAGLFAVAWEDDHDGHGAYEILARTFNADGSPRTGNTSINAVSAGQHVSASVGMADAGTYAVVWQDDRRGRGNWSILLRLRGADGASVTGEVLVHDQVVTFGRLKAENFPEVRRGFFHYGVIANEDLEGAGGWGMIPGEDFIVNQGLNPSRLVLSALFMHELGHNLGLHHGGDEAKNDKPNYLSIMNYRYGLTGVGTDCDGRGDGLLAFSQGRNFDLDENKLDERIGICNGERRVNAINRGQQRKPAIGVAEDGRFVVIWEGGGDDNRDRDVYARAFDDGGVPLAPADTLVNRVGRGPQGGPAVGIASDGRFVVAWEEDQDGHGIHRIHARRFAPDGSPAPGDIITANEVSDGHQRSPDITVAPDGSFVVVWEDDWDGNGSYKIFARLFSADGAPLMRSVRVNPINTRQQFAPRVAIAPDHRFVVAWEDDRRQNGSYQVFARRFTADGKPNGGEIAMGSVSAGQQHRPDVGMDSTGRFVVVWEDDEDGNGVYQIVARRFDAAGEALGAQFTVNQVSAGQHRLPRVHANAAFEFVVTWQDDRDRNGSYEILARPYPADGSARASEVRLNSVSSGQRQRPDVGVDDLGRFYAAWQEDRHQNGSYEILAVRSTAQGAPRDPVAIDWDESGSISETIVSANIKGTNGDDYLAILRDHDDWSHLRLAFGRSVAQPPSAYPSYTPEQMELIRKLVPGGASLTVKDIEERMRQARSSTGTPTLVLPSQTPPAAANEDAIKADVLQNSGSELSHVSLKIRSGDRPASPGRHEFQGDLVKVDPQTVILRESGTGRSVTLDFSWTPGLKLSALTQRGPLTGAWGVMRTLAGDVEGVALRDASGLLFATESRRSGRILKDADLAPFSFRQKRDDPGEPARTGECYRVYFPDVAVSVGTPGPVVVVPHGRQGIVPVGSVSYLVTIVRSEHTETVPCGIASEKAPWVLEYLVRRLDDPREVQSLEDALNVNEAPNPQDGKDDPSPSRKDGHPQ